MQIAPLALLWETNVAAQIPRLRLPIALSIALGEYLVAFQLYIFYGLRQRCFVQADKERLLIHSYHQSGYFSDV